ncbi:MAG: FGGY family carbohydrate kinase [Verrucomicrobiota bacterium]|nr:FGGY family carbohydrate kinase [Verrucomicrobiota bacterium]
MLPEARKGLMDTLLGIDLGTSAIKGVLLASDGRILARERKATELIRPRPGYVEFSSERSYELLGEVIRSLILAASGSKVRAIALSGATGNTLLLDRNGVPLANAINWMDARAADDLRVDPAGITPAEIYRTVGWPYFRGFPLVELAWLKQNRPDLFDRAAMAAMNITYLYHRLTGRYGMDHSTATTFYLQDQVKRAWHKPFLTWLGLRTEQLPVLLPSGTVLGTVTARSAKDTRLPEGAAVVMGAFDHPSAARGCGALRPGKALLSCGTSWVGFYPVADREIALSQNMLADPFLSPAGPWGAMFSLPRIGEKVQEFVARTFAAESSMSARYAKFNETAGRSPPGAGDSCRALMENIALDTKAKMDSLRLAGLRYDRIVMVGGPAESPVWTQILADTIGVEIVLTEAGAYAGALGAAILAGIGTRIFADETDGFARIRRSDRVVRPGSGRTISE